MSWSRKRWEGDWGGWLNLEAPGEGRTGTWKVLLEFTATMIKREALGNCMNLVQLNIFEDST
jgi:hypothetical protein